MSMVHEIDYGTPRSRAEKTVTLTIDGTIVTVPEGTSIMRAAMEMGTQIPKLCATDMLDAFGSCRLCLVEIEGRAGRPLQHDEIRLALRAGRFHAVSGDERAHPFPRRFRRAAAPASRRIRRP